MMTIIQTESGLVDETPCSGCGWPMCSCLCPATDEDGNIPKESIFNEAVELALRTWYPKDHELHLNPHHPLGKLLGEWGELLDDYMKSIYKPGYKFEPLDELGDIWYYLRILCHQYSVVPDRLDKVVFPEIDLDIVISSEDTAMLIGAVMYVSSRSFISGLPPYFNFNMAVIEEIANRYNITLQQLTDSNWEKLKPGSERGEQWMEAREQTDYVGGKITKK